MTTRPLLCAALAATMAACGSSGPAQRPQAADRAASQTTSTAQAGPQWPAAADVNQTVLEAMPAGASGQVRESPVPVLVPADRRVLAGSNVIVGASHYTFASSTNGVTVSVQASSAPKESPASAGPAPAPAQLKAGSRNVSITENEGIRVATWFENGVAYSADVECATAADPRCTDNEYLLSLVRDLAFVGGRPR